MIVCDLDLHRIGDPVIIVGAVYDHPAVGSDLVHKLQIELEILMLPRGPDNLVFQGDNHIVFDHPASLLKVSLAISFSE
jgi:hypothetical protein